MIRFFKSVKLQLTLWYAVVLTILLSVFAFFMYSELQRALYRDIDEKLRNDATQLVEAISGPLEPTYKKIFQPQPALSIHPMLTAEKTLKLQEKMLEWEKNTQRLRKTSSSIRILSLNHIEILSNLSGWQSEIIFPDFERDSIFMETGHSYQTIHFQKKPIRLYYHLATHENNPVFVLQVGGSLVEVEGALHRLAFIIWILIPGTVLAACLAGWFLAKRSFQPVDSMIKEAKQITAAYLKGRLPQSGSGDEVDRLAGTLNEMLDRIESSTRAIQDFSSDISHELRTPLAIIRGEIDLALRRSRSTEALLETLRVIEGEINELIRLVDDLMILVRSDARRLKFDRRNVSLRAILNAVVNRFRDRALTKNIQIETHLVQEAIILGDELYLKRLFSNLLDNAIKYTPEGGKVEVGLQLEGNAAVLIEVKDNGMGIELEQQAKVFSRFYRTDQARSHEGSGLGLNIAKAICDAHQGEIHIESKPREGTRVLVRFQLSSY